MAADKHTENNSHSPLAQFEVKSIYELDLFGYNIDITNSSLAMIVASLCAVILFLSATKNKQIIPGRVQVMAEFFYGFIKDMLISSAGKDSMKFFPLAFSLFMFILFSNLLGMLPYSFTSTSHIIVTFALSAFLFVVVVTAAFFKHGLKFFSIFMPSGTPMFLAPLLIVIEFFAYLARPVSLSIRLAANMTAGHTMMKVIAGFILSLGFVGGWLPLIFLVILSGFEIFVAILQAYIFTMLACVYLSDAVELHH
jgi:F-type H+-transporting ATPase subunit a